MPSGINKHVKSTFAYKYYVFTKKNIKKDEINSNLIYNSYLVMCLGTKVRNALKKK